MLFSRLMFEGFKVSDGITLLASLSVLSIVGMILLYFFMGGIYERGHGLRGCNYPFEVDWLECKVWLICL